MVALRDDGRLVELDNSGTETRTIFSDPHLRRLGTVETKPPGWRGGLRGPLAVSWATRTVYVELESGSQPCPLSSVELPMDSVGDIVAIPLAGGQPTVVVAHGRAPALSPDGRHLAFVGPQSGLSCGPRAQWPIGILDLDSGQTRTIAPDVGDPTIVGTTGAAQPRWASNDALVVLALGPPVGDPCVTCVRSTKLIWIDGVAPGQTPKLTALDDRVASAIPSSPGVSNGPSVPAVTMSALYETFDVVDAGAPSPWPAETRDGQIRLVTFGVATRESQDGHVVGEWGVLGHTNDSWGALPELDPSAFGFGRFVVPAVTISPVDGRLAIVAYDSDSPVGHSHGHLFVADAEGMHKIADDVTAVAWIGGSDTRDGHRAEGVGATTAPAPTSGSTAAARAAPVPSGTAVGATGGTIPASGCPQQGLTPCPPDLVECPPANHQLGAMAAHGSLGPSTDDLAPPVKAQLLKFAEDVGFCRLASLPKGRDVDANGRFYWDAWRVLTSAPTRDANGWYVWGDQSASSCNAVTIAIDPTGSTVRARVNSPGALCPQGTTSTTALSGGR